MFLPSEPNAIQGYARLSLAFLSRSLVPGLEHSLPDCESSHWLRYVAYCTAWKPATFHYARFSLAFLRRSRPPVPVAYSGHESSLWLIHTVNLIYANWGLNFLSSGSREIEIFRTRPRAFIRPRLGNSDLWARGRPIFPDNTASLSQGAAPSFRWITPGSWLASPYLFCLLTSVA